jgi:hypothetical protein
MRERRSYQQEVNHEQKGEKNTSHREGKGVTLRNKYVKSEESVEVMCQVEKIQGTDKTKIC